MFIAFATVVDKEARWDFPAVCFERMLYRRGLDAFGVGDISTQP
jgi:hypothetical protein